MFSHMQKNSEQYIVDRRHLEGAEAGRRQKEGLVYPNSNK